MEVFSGKVKKGIKTKNILRDLNKEEIILTFHRDLDKLVAAEIIDKGIKVVLNAAESITGKYPNYGPQKLLENNVVIIDKLGEDFFSQLNDGDQLDIEGAKIKKNNSIIARGHRLDYKEINYKLKQAKNNFAAEYSNFVANTIEHIKTEKNLFNRVEFPKLKTDLNNKEVFIVTRGDEYLEDLRVLRPYLERDKLVLIGVDGGANALLDYNYLPDIIIGDMDSANKRALNCGAELLVHSYTDGGAPGNKRIKALGLKAKKIKIAGTSEDAAMLLAYTKGAKKIIIIGSHSNSIDFFDKKRKGMASTFLIRSKIGHKLIDLKGVNKVYQYLH